MSAGPVPPPPSLFDPPEEVIAATDDGIARSYEARSDTWKDAARDEVRYLAGELEAFTTDEVIERLELRGIHPENLMGLGHVMRQAASDGWIRNSGTRRRTRIKRRHRELTVWHSLKPAAADHAAGEVDE